MTAVAERQEWLAPVSKPKADFWKREKYIDSAKTFFGFSDPDEYISRRTAQDFSHAHELQKVDEVDLRRKFYELSKGWQAETMFVSSVHQRVMHPLYQRIIGLGPRVLPLLIEDLSENKNDWFWALRSITGVDPVPESIRGNRDAMITCWVRWAKSEGIF